MNKIKHFLKNISPLNNRIDMPVPLFIIKVIIIFFFVKFGSEVICEGAVIALHLACGKNPLKGEIFDPNTITLITYYGYALMIGIMFLYWKIFQKETIIILGFNKHVETYILGGFIGSVLVVVSTLLIIFSGRITYKGMFENIGYIYILLMFGGFIFQGAMEETLCRGIVLTLLRKRTSIYVAAGVNTALFMVVHLANMSLGDVGITTFAIINLILIGLVLSFLTIYFKNIWVACGLHTVWNFILYNILGLNLSGKDNKTVAVFDMESAGSNVINGGEYGIEASVITAIVLAIALIIILVMYNQKGRD